MDIYVGIGVVLLVIAIFGLLATSMLSIKGRSYEEALAEQREVTNELLGFSSHSNRKDKKIKKIKKIVQKNKKNQPVDEKNSVIHPIECTRSIPEVNRSEQKLQIEFKEALILEDAVDPTKKKFQNVCNKNKVRPILVHRQETKNIDMPSVNKLVITTNQEPANHFQQRHPEVALELLQSNDIEESKEAKRGKGNKSITSDQYYIEDQQNIKKSTKNLSKVEEEMSNEKQATITTESKQLHPIIEETISINTNVNLGVVKENKKKTNVHYSTGNKQLVQQSNGVASMASLFPLVCNAELSRSEVQKFIDMLLNKQLEAPSVLDDWSEGRADPLQKAKRQLLEREKQLEGEQEAKMSLQQKLIKLREELNHERTECTRRTKLLKEALHAQQQATQHHSQQMQTQINDANKFRADYAALQRQHKQLEMHATKVAEVEEARIKKLVSDNQEMQLVIGQLQKDVLNLTEHLRHASDKSQLALTELNTAGMDLVRKDDLIRELEQSRINMEHQHKTDFDQMQSHLQQQNEEIRRYEFNNDEMQKKRNDTERLVAQLRNELVQTQEQSIHGALATSEGHQVEVRKLQNELSSFRSQLNTAVRDHKQVIGNLQNELDKQREKNNDENNKSGTVNDIVFYRNFVQRLFPSLNLSNDLSTEDILTQAKHAVQTILDDLDWSKNNEGHLQNKIERLQETIVNFDEKGKSWTANDLISRNFVQRLFPTLHLSKDLSTEDILTQAKLSVQTVFDELDRSKTAEVQLQNKIERLQEAIIDSDTTLKLLYERIRQEEIDWRSKLNEKDAEINSLRPEPQILANSRNSYSSINGSTPDLEETNGN